MIPIGSRILVRIKPETKEERMAGGVIIPGQFQTASMREGTVVSAGPECKQIKAGMRVALPKYLAHEIQYNGLPHALLHEDEALGVLPDN